MSSEQARRYFDAGWHPLELPPAAKYPPPEGRTGYDGVDMTLEEVTAAPWAGNIGSRMPPDIIGLDIDAYKGGLATLAELTARLGKLPPTIISHNGRDDGSGIRYFRVPVGMTWISGLPGIDIIQRVHRYSVFPPSTHPDDGRVYDWWDQTEGAPFEGVPEVEAVPELGWTWIAELSRPDASSASSPARAVGLSEVQAFIDAHDRQDQGSYLTVIVAHFLDRKTAGYSRHDTMQHCLTWAMECVAAGVLAAQPTLQELADVWVRAVNGEVRRMELWSDRRTTEFDAMLRHAIGKVAVKSEAELIQIHDGIAGITVNFPPKPEVIDDYHPSTLPRPVNWSTFADRDENEDPWLVESFWPTGRAMALWATAKTGKSELALWCAVKLAIGEHPWSGAPLEPVDVAYFDFEMTGNDLEDRLASFGISLSRLAHLHYWLLPDLAFLDTDTGGKQMVELVTEFHCRAAVIDTYGRAVGGEEDKADTVNRFSHYTGKRLKALGVGYIRTDHAGKDRTRGQRGSSAKRDDVDVIWQMSQKSSGGTLLDCTGSSRLSWVGPKLDIDRQEVGGVLSYSAPVRMGWPGGTAAKAAELDAIGLPLDTSRRKARAALEAAGLVPGKNEVIAAAIAFRLAQAAGTTPGTTP